MRIKLIIIHYKNEMVILTLIRLSQLQRLARAGSQPFHDVMFTAMKCTRSMYIVENGRQKLALLQITCARGNTL